MASTTTASTEPAPQVTASKNETQKSLKPQSKIVKKSEKLSSSVTKEAKRYSQIQATNKDEKEITGEVPKDVSNVGNSGSIIAEEKIPSEKATETNKLDENIEGNFAGMIFMCNSRTKPDCFKYQVMGVTLSKKEIVLGIKPGLKLFLYDFESRLLYGIYEASSAGSGWLEREAFGGAFPFQVRFKVHKECIPLPEFIFKAAIKENYNVGTSKFKTELTHQQVMKLMQLFQLVPVSQANTNPPAATPISTISDTTEIESVKERAQITPPVANTTVTTRLEMASNASENCPKYPYYHNATSFLSQNGSQVHGLRQEVATAVTTTIGVATTPTMNYPEYPHHHYGPQYRQELSNTATTTLGNFPNHSYQHHFNPQFLQEKGSQAYGFPQELPTAGIRTSITPTENYQKYPYYHHAIGTQAHSFKHELITAVSTTIGTGTTSSGNYPIYPYHCHYNSTANSQDKGSQACGPSQKLPAAVSTTIGTATSQSDNYPKYPSQGSYASGSVTDRYLSGLRPLPTSMKSHSLMRENVSTSTFVESGMRNYQERGGNDEVRRRHIEDFTLDALADNKQKHHDLRGQNKANPNSVSSRYDFTALQCRTAD